MRRRHKLPDSVHFLWAVLASVLVLVLTAQTAGVASAVVHARMTDRQLARIGREIADCERILSGGDEGALVARTQRFFCSILSPAQLTELAQRCWEYEIRVNGETVTGSPVEIQGTEAVIELIERERRRFLPEEIHAAGSLTGGDPHDAFYTHLRIIANDPPSNTAYEEQEPGGGYGLTRIYRVCCKPDLVRVLPDPVLQSRIGLSEIVLVGSP